MQTTDVAAATIPASQLAEMLASYGDMPVAVQVIDTRDGHEVATAEGIEGVHIEINARRDGSRYIAIVGFRPELDPFDEGPQNGRGVTW